MHAGAHTNHAKSKATKSHSLTWFFVSVSSSFSHKNNTIESNEMDLCVIMVYDARAMTMLRNRHISSIRQSGKMPQRPQTTTTTAAASIQNISHFEFFRLFNLPYHSIN